MTTDPTSPTGSPRSRYDNDTRHCALTRLCSQFIIMVISLALYGFGPVGVELFQGKGQVLSRGLFIEEVDYLEPSNFWFGPRPADLIHLGAKFSPCMRQDKTIQSEIEAAHALEKQSGI